MIITDDLLTPTEIRARVLMERAREVWVRTRSEVAWRRMMALATRAFDRVRRNGEQIALPW